MLLFSHARGRCSGGVTSLLVKAATTLTSYRAQPTATEAKAKGAAWIKRSTPNGGRNLKDKDLLKALITAVHRERYEVRVDSQEFFARLKTSRYYSERADQAFPTVGDEVILEYNGSGDSQIVETLERRSVFSRKDPDVGMGEQIVAANFDYVFILMSLNLDFNLKRLERYLAVSWQSGAAPVVILTKADLAEDIEDKMEKIREVALGVNVHSISAINGEGLSELDQYLEPGKTVVFLGSSGVGKSTLTNYLLGEEVMETKEIREDDAKGHHTTTYRQMFVLQNGARIIDTPGMRELGVWIVEEGMEKTYADIHELSLRCRFSDCTHNGEPGCAVEEALAEGSLTLTRWKNYLKIQKESKFQAAKESRSKAKEIKNSGKNMSKFQKQMKQHKEIW